VQDHRQRQGHARRQPHRLADDHEALGAAVQDLQPGQQVQQVGPFPILAGQQVVSLGQGDDAGRERLLGLGQGSGGVEGLAGDGLDRGQRVLDPVIQLVDQQPQVQLGPLALGDVDGGADHAHRPAGLVEEAPPLGRDPALLAVVAADRTIFDVDVAAQRRIHRRQQNLARGLAILGMHGGVEVVQTDLRSRRHAEHAIGPLGPAQMALADVEVPGADIARVQGQGHGRLAQQLVGLGRLAVGDVGDHADEAHALALVEEGPAKGLDPALRAVVPPPDPVFAVDRIVAGRIHGGPHGVHQGRQVVGMDQALEGVERVLDHTVRQTVDLAATLVPEAFAGLGIVVPTAQAGGLHGDAQVGLGGFQGLLGALAPGDVDHHPAMADGPALGVALHPAAGLHPFDGAVGLDQTVLLHELAGGLQAGAARPEQPLEIVGMQGLGEFGQRRALGRPLGIDIVEHRVASVRIDPVGDDVPVPGAHPAGRLEGQLVALLAGAQRCSVCTLRVTSVRAISTPPTPDGAVASGIGLSRMLK
jgi:hypothetical protein